MCADARIIAQETHTHAHKKIKNKKKLGAEAGIDLLYNTPCLHKTVQAK